MTEGLTIEHLKPYGTYKASGLDWLGNVPEHWFSAPGFAAFREKKVKNTGMKEKTVLSLSYGRIVVKPLEKLHGLVPDSFETYQIVDPGDIIIRSTDLQNDWNSKRVGLVQNRGIITSAYLCFKTTEKLRSTYGYQLLNALDLMKVFYGMGSGLRQNLDFSDFKRMPVFLPPPGEQDAIVRFLGWATSRLDRAIRAKRKVISLLNEQKQAIIHRAVTRGLDPTIRLKSSGNPWLGEIPEHWGQQALWTLSHLRTERNPGDMKLLSVFLDRGVILYGEGGGQVHAPSLDLSNYQVVRTGDFVLNNQQAWRGSVGVSRHDGIISPAYIVLSLSNCLDPTFANYLMRSKAMVDQFVAASKGVGDIQRQVFWPFLRMVQVPLPALEEQRELANYLGTATAGLIHSITRLEREIDLLREYRTRLVSDVVTGKLDVREAALNLPEVASVKAAEDVDADLDEGEFEEEEVEA